MVIDNQTVQPSIKSVRKKTRLLNPITNVGCSNLNSSSFVETVSDRSVASKILRSLAPIAQLITLAKCVSPCSFVVNLPPGADSLRVAALVTDCGSRVALAACGT